jgi:hypothetical protein
MLAVGRRIVSARDDIVEAWFEQVSSRHFGSRGLEPIELRRMLCLIVSLLAHMTGALRREARETWFDSTELYGRLAEARGLSAGEVVDEFRYLRELLIVELGDLIVALPARQQLPTVFRVNRACDMAISSAVVGYTDALVEKMFRRDGIPVPAADSVAEMVASLHRLEGELRFMDERSAG